MSQKKSLYLAENIKNLEILAAKCPNTKNIKRIDKLCEYVDKIYLHAKEDPNDEEKTYVYLIRYLKLVDEIRKLKNDEKFVQARFGSNLRWCNEECTLIRKNLVNRYNEINHREDSLVDKLNTLVVNGKQSVTAIIESPKKIFTTELFVLCQEVVNLHNLNSYRMLIIDIRPEVEYEISHLKDINTVNVPENYIKPGLSANVLEQSLPQITRECFKNRSSYDVIILMDWNTSAQKYPMSKLQVLHEILTKWEYNITYKFKPFVLDGGYLAWIEKYPTLSTNSCVMYDREYSDLDELLDLDNIQYPTDLNNTTMTLILNEEKAEPTHIPTPTRDTLLSKLYKIATQQLNNEKNLLKTQKCLIDINKGIRETKSAEYASKFKREKIDLENEVSKYESLKIQLDERKNKLNKEFSLNASFEPGSDQDQMKEIASLEEEIVQIYKLRKSLLNTEETTVAEDKEVAPVGPVGPIGPVDPVVQASRENKTERPVVPVPKKPIVDRKRKPTTMVYLPGKVQYVSNGLTGLENIRNTCYMNTLIQCMRHLPAVMSYFCTGAYSLALKEKDLQIIVEFAELVRCLWTNSHTVIRPTKFYNKLCRIEPMYGEGQHECVHMFFLNLLENLHEDCGSQVDSKNNSCKFMAWLIKFKGKFSFFLKHFYHQIQETQLCNQCGKKAVRFQSEPTLMLAVPDNKDFTLDEVLEDYFTQDCKYCTKCNVQCKVTKVFSYYPPIVTIALKRYYSKQDRNTKFYRNNNACLFKTENLMIGTQRYKLHAIALHQGTLNAGHYTAACLNPKDNLWYEYNDSVVQLMDINDDRVKVKAYVLFYVAMSQQITHS